MSSEPLSDDTILRVENVGKFYPIYAKPIDRLKQAFWRGRKQFFQPFWALRNVSFEVKRGQSVGILGRNGSGKSTLLQIIASTLAPTEGQVRLRGRVAALLELGSGFNMEFTGRENVYLNASVLGLTREEIDARFHEIETFADIGEYIDRPLKTYSSGMFGRLAFAVAISVEPDILLVDEILSVGDIGFQQKCVARMRQMRERGMTLLFVTHSPDSIRSICQKGLFLNEGQPMYWGASEPAVDLYLNHIREKANEEALQSQSDLMKPVPFQNEIANQMRYGTGHVQIQRIELLNEAGQPCRAFRFGETIVLETELLSFIEVENLSVSFLLRDATGIDLTGTTTLDEEVNLPGMGKNGRMTVRFRIQNNLRAGSYGVCMAANRVAAPDRSDNVLFDQVDGSVAFTVVADPDRPVHYKFHNPVEIEFDCGK